MADSPLSKISHHPKIDDIDRALIGGMTLSLAADTFFADEIKNGVDPQAIRMRLSRYRKTALGKKIQAAKKRATKRKAEQLLDMATDLGKETMEIRRQALAEKQWDSVGEMSGHAREDLKFVADLLGAGASNQQQQEGPAPNVMFQNLIAMPHVGEMYAPAPQPQQQQQLDGEVIDVDDEEIDDELDDLDLED